MFACRDLAITSSRTLRVDFSTAIYANSLRLVVRKPTSIQLNWFSYLDPFSLPLWLTTLGCIIFGAILTWMFEHKENNDLKIRSLPSGTILSMWYSLANIFGFGAEFGATTAAGRLLTLGLRILSLILMATYTAQLTSFLTVKSAKSTITGINDIINNKIPYSRIGVVSGTSGEEYFLKAISLGRTDYYHLPTTQDIFTKLLDNTIDVAVASGASAVYAIDNIYCKLTLAGDPFYATSIAIDLPKLWPYKQALNVELLTIKESGLLEGIMGKYFNTLTCGSSSDAATGSSSMTVESLAGLFLTFACICVLAILLHFWFRAKIHVFKIIRRRKQEKSQRSSTNHDNNISHSNAVSVF
ncbi:unnamed protein product [Didymodactylos carnosus]|uniref:Ionotropic glutamate receptor C-terminal domain-containing protein n=1 Tax=Didymodactylos carnosus TaxID=1234261 RepID=A0A815FS30_9BILA|nr:unnamed protein product [Didymodactylos carnosus]CAF1329877.1 unnamed protein product [Didymodactylos carnosus]CAF3835502.1 unnamed protein product [Didymodactylos carnosus]CAF4182509.1 unnamed protein product [Didymodactylos carnosus]